MTKDELIEDILEFTLDEIRQAVFDSELDLELEFYKNEFSTREKTEESLYQLINASLEDIYNELLEIKYQKINNEIEERIIEDELPEFFNDLSGVKDFEGPYHLFTDYEIKGLPYFEGIYTIVLVDEQILYPYDSSNVIYIGMSEDNMARRLTSHINNNVNFGLTQYIEEYDTAYYYCEPHRNKNIKNLEIDLLTEFHNTYGRIPICNAKLGN